MDEGWTQNQREGAILPRIRHEGGCSQKIRGRLVKLESVEIESTGLLRRSEQACIMHAKPGCHREGSYLASYAASEFGRLRPSLHHHHLHKCGSN